MRGRRRSARMERSGRESGDRIIFLRRSDPRAPRFRREVIPDDRAERFQWASWIPTMIALTDAPLPDGVVGYVVRSAGIDSATIVLSRIGLEPGNYETLRLIAADAVASDPVPERAAVTTIEGGLSDRTVTERREDGARRSWTRPPDSFMDPNRRGWITAWQRARLYQRFEGAPRSTVLGMSARTRLWERTGIPTFPGFV